MNDKPSLRGKNREIALATLVELLVQVVFIFTLVLVVSQAIEGSPEERGWIAPESWRTLISIFDIDPRKLRSVDAQTEEIRRRFLEAQRERDQARAEATRNRAALDEELARLHRLAGRGGPGHPVCRDARGGEQVVIEAVVDAQGLIRVRAMRPGDELSPLPADLLARAMTPVQFREATKPWREQGLGRMPACAYKALIEYDASAPAGLYERARLAVFSYFHMAAPPKSQ